MVTLTLEGHAETQIQELVLRLMSAPAALADFQTELREAAELGVAQINENFARSALLVAPLADATKQRRLGRLKRDPNAKLVAELDTPLRAFHDSLRRAATALEPGVTGSAYAKGREEITFGVNPDATPYMRAVLLGYNHIPDRDAILTTGQDAWLDAADALIGASWSKRLDALLSGF